MLPRPHPAVLFEPVPGGAILLHTENEIYFELNAVGVEVWELLPPACTRIDEACDRLASRYPDVPAESLRADVVELLDGLSTEGLVIPAET
ncbi:MAG TPA: PqqD family protein [Longimicrobiales bacterium]|nr:PqqD family protein [Longimicrobiales bacterium]